MLVSRSSSYLSYLDARKLRHPVMNRLFLWMIVYGADWKVCVCVDICVVFVNLKGFKKIHFECKRSREKKK